MQKVELMDQLIPSTIYSLLNSSEHAATQPVPHYIYLSMALFPKLALEVMDLIRGSNSLAILTVRCFLKVIQALEKLKLLGAIY